MGNLQVRFLEGWAPAMAPGYSTVRAEHWGQHKQPEKNEHMFAPTPEAQFTGLPCRSGFCCITDTWETPLTPDKS